MILAGCCDLNVGVVHVRGGVFRVIGDLSRQISNPRRFAKFMSDNAFSVYVFHPPVVILGARMLHGLGWHIVAKFALLTVLASVVSFGLSAAVFRRIPLLRAIL